MWNTLVEYLQYPFVRRILVAGVLVAFCASMLGVTLVLKRFSYIGDGLSLSLIHISEPTRRS